MMIRIFSFFSACLFLLSSSALAEQMRLEPRAVVELFTSQGCSSCPPADEILSELSGRDDVIALAYHVDYWDYIGWPDTFGSAANSDLQRAYASAQGKNRIYTPQLMINGAKDVVGSRRADVENGLARTQLNVPIRLENDNGYLQVVIGGDTTLPEANVWLVTFRDNAEVDIQRGENRGKVLTYSKIVTDRQVLGMWEPDTGAHIKLPLDKILLSEGDGAAILVQEDVNGLPGRILGAASYIR